MIVNERRARRTTEVNRQKWAKGSIGNKLEMNGAEACWVMGQE